MLFDGANGKHAAITTTEGRLNVSTKQRSFKNQLCEEA
jgi:hypothetical protein